MRALYHHKHHLNPLHKRTNLLKTIDDALKKQQRLKNRFLDTIIAERKNISLVKIDKIIQQVQREIGPASKNMSRGELLVHSKTISKIELEEALVQHHKEKKKSGESVQQENSYTDREMNYSGLAEKFDMEFIDICKINPDEKTLAILPLKIVQQLQIFPIELYKDHLLVAISDPNDPSIIDTLRFVIGRRVECVLATSDQIRQAIDRHFSNIEKLHVDNLIDEMVEDDIEIDKEVEYDVDESDSKIIKLVNNILVDAYNRGASDIHVEPGAGNEPVQIRYRLDGICHETHAVPATYKKAFIARLKIMSHLDISERRRPQSGRIIIRFNKKKIEFRLEITPSTMGNEDAVLRILTGSKLIKLDKMGFLQRDLDMLKMLLEKPQGILLCVGPTGSGKTTTLHSGLSYINTTERKIWTAEDPVEITQAGLRQVQIHQKIGFTFKEALRSFMRSDPDVIMIGEMRDRETASIAIESSLTGHLVLSTLHTNSAPETVIRLIEMGIDPYNFADALLGILAQRLIRKLCIHCRKPYVPSKREYEKLVSYYGQDLFSLYKLDEYFANPTLMKRVGCEKCGQIGYINRIAIFELLIGSQEVKQSIKSNATVVKLKERAISQGMNTLRMNGILKVFQGITDLDEVLKACPLEVTHKSTNKFLFRD